MLTVYLRPLQGRLGCLLGLSVIGLVDRLDFFRGEAVPSKMVGPKNREVVGQDAEKHDGADSRQERLDPEQ